MLGLIRRCRPLGAAVAIALLTGCTTTTITPQMVEKPTQSYNLLELGEIQVQDKIWAPQVAWFRRGFVARLKEVGSFATVADPADPTLPIDAIVVSGEITEIDKGSAVARFLIGMGAGRARAGGRFAIADASGKVLAKFDSAKAYSGGIGIGGADFLDIDEIMQKFGADTADAVVRWSKGQAIDDTSNQHQ
jgi:hypothetical protein